VSGGEVGCLDHAQPDDAGVEGEGVGVIAEQAKAEDLGVEAERGFGLWSPETLPSFADRPWLAPVDLSEKREVNGSQPWPTAGRG